MYPAVNSGSDVGGPDGHSYGAVILPADALAPDALSQVLAGIRFSGWIAPAEGAWRVLLGDPGDGVVADERRGVIEVGAVLAGHASGPILAVRVLRDRQLALVAWSDGQEVARYSSDPSREHGAGEDVLSDPIGAEDAIVLATLWDRPDAVEQLTELLEEEIDPDSVYESERAGRTLRLLGLPAWIVASAALPRAMPTGPKPSELVHLRAGLTGMAGRTKDAVVRPIRKRQHPPPVIEDPPSGGGAGLESWMF